VIYSQVIRVIVSFSVSNFRSFSSEETFSLVASGRLSAHPEHTVPIPDSKERVLRAVVLYGANGAGKSNLFKALQYVESVALNSRKKGSGTGRTAFRFGGKRRDEPSSFDLQFIVQGKLYRFGFRVDDQRITEEWLAQVIGEREVTIYERLTDDDGKVTIDPQGIKGEKLSALAKVGGPPNQSFLATINVTLNAPDLGDQLGGILMWFRRDLNLIEPDEPLVPIGHLSAEDPDFLKFASEFLKSSSTGVDHLDILKKEVSEDELRKFLAKDVQPTLFKDLIQGEGPATIVSLSGGNELLVERKDGTHYYIITVQAAHENRAGEVVPLELTEESDGTQRLLNLIPALHHLKTKGAVYFIDEIDRSLHPILILNFLKFFLATCHGGESQILVTTHESNLLDLDLLRRDEIWFAEKDEEAATRLYSLMDFRVRKDHEIRKHYLEGRFGAVPFLGNLDCLLADEAQQK